jgi:hypothetical protein
MGFSLEDLNKLSDVELDKVPELDGWVEPSEYPPLPQPGKYAGVIQNIHRIDETAEKNLIAAIDIQIQGGQFDGRLVTFQSLSTKLYDRGGSQTSQFLDIGMAANALQETPRTNREYAQVLLDMQQQRKRFGFQFDWEGSCYNCYKMKLQNITGKDDYDVAKFNAQKQDKKLAGDFALKAKDSRDFPEAATGGKKDSMTCPDCRQEIRARGRVKRYFRLGA